MLDIDRFKEINDSFGHLEGDNALKIAANTLKEAAGEKDLVFRYGGDEFLILSCSDDPDHLDQLKQKIHTSLKALNESRVLP